MRIGFVNKTRLFQTYSNDETGTRVSKELDLLAERLANKIAEYEAKSLKVNDFRDALGPVELNELYQDLHQLEGDIAELKLSIRQLNQEENNRRLRLISDLLEGFRKDQGYDLILNREAARIYHPNTDVTAKLLEAQNA